MIFFIDLDGTLLNPVSAINLVDAEALGFLRDNGVVVVIATGRNLFSVREVLSDSLPVDYIIFSTGVGILNFRTNFIIKDFMFDSVLTSSIAYFLRSRRVNFFMHFCVPENHRFFFNYEVEDMDFYVRLRRYSAYSAVIPDDLRDFCASQFVVIFPYDLRFFEDLRIALLRNFPDLSIVRATSPINHSHIWLEIYPSGVNKGSAAKALCDILDVDVAETVAIGNDYNDVSLLDFVQRSFVVANSPEELKQKYQVVMSNSENGFAEAVSRLFEI